MKDNIDCAAAPHPCPIGRELFSPAAWRALGDFLALSPQELRIVQYVFQRRPRGSMAHELEISPHTVHAHFCRLYRKLGVADQSELILRVFDECIRLCPLAASPASPHGRTPG